MELHVRVRYRTSPFFVGGWGGPDTRPPDVNSENENVRANFPAE
jgi:hypothetical protein